MTKQSTPFIPPITPSRRHWRSTLLCLLLPWASGPLMAAETTPTLQAPARTAPLQTERLDPRTLRRPLPAAGETTESEPEEPSGPQGGSGVYVLDDVDFHPVGGGAIPGLGFNAQVPVTGFYEYADNSYILVSGTVHGDGLISGPGQDDWTFVVKLDVNDVISGRPAGCQFADYRRAQTDASSTAWKYQLMIVFHDTASKPECFEYFRSLEGKPFPVKLIDIVGPYWTGDKQYQEPTLRYYHTGPMLSVHDNHAAGHTAQPWSAPLP